MKLTDDLYYRKLENTSTTDLVDMIRDKDKQIAELEKDRDYFSDALDKQIEATLKLEKENAELRNLKEVADLIRLNNSSVVTMAQLNNNNVALRKENAELKNQLEMSNKVYNDNLDYSHHIEGQLTKAKELLERLLITSCNSDVLRVRVEAEQFIKDSEVEK